MLRKLLLILVILLPYYCLAQENISKKILDSDVSPHLKRQKLDSLINHLNEHKAYNELNHVLYDYSSWLNKHKKYNQAKGQALLSLNITKQYFPKDQKLVQQRLYLLGLIYFNNRDYQNSIATHKRCIDINPESDYAIKSYSLLGRNFYKLKDFYKAIDYHKLSNSFLNPKNDIPNIISNYINIGLAYQVIGGIENIEKGREYLQLADSLSKQVKLNYVRHSKLLINLAQTYNHIETLDIPKANYYFNRSYNIAKKHKDSSLTAMILRLKGNLYNTTNLDSTIFYQKESLKYIKKTDIASLVHNYSDLAYSNGQHKQFSESKKYYNKTVELLTGKKIDALIKNRKLALQCNDKNNLLILLTEYCDVLFKEEKENTAHAQKIIDIYFLADQLIDLIQINTSEFNSRLHWRKKATEIYSKATKACYNVNATESAFYFMEKNKALVLMEDMRLEYLKQNSKLPKSLLKKIQQLKTDIFFLKNSSVSINEELLTKKEELAQLNDSIKKLNPTAIEIQNDSFITSLVTTQKNLSNNDCIIEYLIHKNIGYGLYISNKSSILFELKDINSLQKNTDELLQKMSVPFTTKGDKAQYHKLAHTVYNQLLPEERIKQKIENKKLIIIPDNFLNYLPFEALSINEKNYLIERNEISYVFSNSIQKNADYKVNNEQPITLFAPESFNHSNLVSLENSITEATAINNIIDSDLFIQNEATKTQFLKQLPHSKIMHLATHANAHDSIAPWIAFNDQKLTLEELYLTKNNAELIVLSGCKTNKGKLAIGEGVMSLSRGFFQTGSKSIISSLWSIDDKSTASIMTTFYKNLKQHKTKSNALRSAKLTYLNNHSLSETSPYYWAPLVLIGDNSSISKDTSSSFYYYFIALLFFISSYLIYKKLSS